MYGYKITFSGLPTPVWGCETTINNYNWVGTHPENRIEISIIKAPYLVQVKNNQKNVYENIYALSCGVADGFNYCYSKPDVQVSITTVAVRFENLNIVAKDLSIDDCGDTQSILLPSFLDVFSVNELDEINILLHKYIKHSQRSSAYDSIMCYSLLYNTLAKIDSAVRNKLSGNVQNTYNYYIKKANWIINERYNTKLTKSIIAKELGISVGYLTAVYKKSTGKTISEYLLSVRMHKAEALLEDINMPTVKIAAAVGFDDETYFRKRFKQYFGMNVKEYRNIKHGNTLYHNKPTRGTMPLNSK